MIKSLFCSCSHKEIRFWSSDSKKCFKTISNAHKYWIFDVCLISRFQLASGGSDSCIRIWNLKTMKCEKRLLGHAHSVLCVKLLSPTQLVSSSADGVLKLWDLDTGRCIRSNKIDPSGIHTLVRLTQYQIAFSGRRNSKIRSIEVYNIHTQKHCFKMTGHEGMIWKIINMSDDRIASCSNDKLVKVWNWRSGEVVQTLRGHFTAVKTIAKVDESGKKLVSCSVAHVLKIWDVETGSCLRTIMKAHSDTINSILCYSVPAEDELVSHSFVSKILTASDDNTVKMWDEKTGKVEHVFQHKNDVMTLSLLSPPKLVKNEEMDEKITFMYEHFYSSSNYRSSSKKYPFFTSVIAKLRNNNNGDQKIVLPSLDENSISPFEFQKLLMGCEIEDLNITEEQYFDLWVLFKTFDFSDDYFGYLYHIIGEVADVDILLFLFTKALINLEHYSCPLLEKQKILHIKEPKSTLFSDASKKYSLEYSEKVEKNYYKFMERNLDGFIQRVERTVSSDEKSGKKFECIPNSKSQPVVFYHLFTYHVFHAIMEKVKMVCENEGYATFHKQIKYLQDLGSKIFKLDGLKTTKNSMKSIFEGTVTNLYMNGVGNGFRVRGNDSDDETLSVHKEVLMWCSKFFWNCMKFKGIEFYQEVLTVEFLSFNELKSLIEFIYTGEIQNNKNSVKELIKILEFSEMHFEKDLQLCALRLLEKHFERKYKENKFYVEISRFGSLISLLPKLLQEKFFAFWKSGLGVNIEEVKALVEHSRENLELVHRLLDESN